jgi:hypothetical protein
MIGAAGEHSTSVVWPLFNCDGLSYAFGKCGVVDDPSTSTTVASPLFRSICDGLSNATKCGVGEKPGGDETTRGADR